MGNTAFEIPDLNRIHELIPKYDRPGPRYTSYPTAPVWTDEFGEAEFVDALGRAVNRDLSLYVHIPFCERLCSFCACNRVITQDHNVADPYLDALEIEADRVANAIGGTRKSVQLAIGGGTPTFLTPSELSRMCTILDSRFPPDADAERSIEIDPRVTSREQLAALAEHGFNRVSLGVQDFNPKVQKAINRVQSIEQTAQLTQDARELGFRSVNFDLIYGLPFQSLASFSDTVDRVLELRPERIALYSYAHVTWIQKSQRGFEKKDLPDAERKLAIMLQAIQQFQAKGYQFLGLDHFALPNDDLYAAAESGTLRRNFMGYTTRAGVNLVAFGASAISELGDAYAQSVRAPKDWQDKLERGELATMRGWRLSDDDLRRKWLIQELMCQGEINHQNYYDRFNEDLSVRIPELAGQLSPLVEDGLLIQAGRDYRLTAAGRLFSRIVAMVFDAYLPDPNSDRPLFSRTV